MIQLKKCSKLKSMKDQIGFLRCLFKIIKRSEPKQAYWFKTIPLRSVKSNGQYRVLAFDLSNNPVALYALATSSEQK